MKHLLRLFPPGLALIVHKKHLHIGLALVFHEKYFLVGLARVLDKKPAAIIFARLALIFDLEDF